MVSFGNEIVKLWRIVVVVRAVLSTIPGNWLEVNRLEYVLTSVGAYKFLRGGLFRVT